MLVILDGFGDAPPGAYNAVERAATPFWDGLKSASLYRTLRAHGKAVGLSSDADMGNSEVGHNILGAGRVFDQGPKQVADAFASGEVWGSVWQEAVSRARAGCLHIVGLLSDGNVHSHVSHIEQMVHRAAEEGVREVRVHALLDGRDVPDYTAGAYLSRMEQFLSRVQGEYGARALLASGGGRQRVTMDRYGADWVVVERGYRAHVLGEGAHFTSSKAALDVLRGGEARISDQELGAFVVCDENGPVGRMQDGDVVILANFRGDRMLEFYEALTASDFRHFDVSGRPELHVVGMTLWDGDRGWPEHRLVTPARVTDSVSEVLARNRVTQYAVAETQKFGHVTYFWNGNKAEPFDDTTEKYVLIPSDPDVLGHPEMRSAETAEDVADAVRSGEWAFVRTNLAAGDMVGHTGDLGAAVKAVEAVDRALAVIHEAVSDAGGTLVILADHGNCEEMALTGPGGEVLLGADGEVLAKTSHTLSAVPLVVWDRSGRRLVMSEDPHMGLGNVGAGLLKLLGIEPPESYAPSVLEVL